MVSGFVLGGRRNCEGGLGTTGMVRKFCWQLADQVVQVSRGTGRLRCPCLSETRMAQENCRLVRSEHCAPNVAHIRLCVLPCTATWCCLLAAGVMVPSAASGNAL